MNAMFKEEEPVHLGYNVQRIREIIGMKQIELGQRCNGWSQQQISKLEQAENIKAENLETLAKGLGVTSEFIRNFKEEKAIYNIQSNNTYEPHSTNSSQHYRPVITHDAADKLAELMQKLIDQDRQKVEMISGLTQVVNQLKEEIENLKRK